MLTLAYCNQCRELGDSVTVYQCHVVLAGLHQRGHHASLSLGSLKAALGVARELRDKMKEVDTLRELAMVRIDRQTDKQTKLVMMIKGHY